MAADSPKTYDLDDLLAVMARLRDPDTGCPWDVKQSFATIAPYTIEEAYEVADAIAREDFDGLKDELGVLLLQVVYHAEMASEQSRFAFADVVDAITRKMIRRHPHVFEDPSRRGEFMTSDLWDRIKAEEKAERGEDSTSQSVLSGVPAERRGQHILKLGTGNQITVLGGQLFGVSACPAARDDGYLVHRIGVW